jgi:hypothetical protein
MKINLITAVNLILALPAHRSQIEGHRKIGEMALDELLSFSGVSDQKEKEYNKTAIAIILSTARAFSVERDRISGTWAYLKEIKQKREDILEFWKYLSPFREKNYWAKLLSVFLGGSAGLSQGLDGLKNIPISTSLGIFVSLILFELVSRIALFFTNAYFEKKGQTDKEEQWRAQSIIVYKSIAEKAINNLLLAQETILGKSEYGQANDQEKKKKIQEIINNSFYFG